MQALQRMYTGDQGSQSELHWLRNGQSLQGENREASMKTLRLP